MECRKEETMTEKIFSQVDNELMLTESAPTWTCTMKQMISNITSDYVIKILNGQLIAENTKPGHLYHQPLEEPLPTAKRKTHFKEPIKSPANVMQRKPEKERVRSEKETHSHSHLTTDPAATTSKRKAERKPTDNGSFQKEKPGELLKYSNRLRQDRWSCRVWIPQENQKRQKRDCSETIMISKE